MDYLIHLSTLVVIYAILGISLNLLAGYSGLLSLSHASFFGIGAYTTAILLTETESGFFVSILLGVLIATLISLIIGRIFSRLKDDYYALGTLGFNTIVFIVLLNWKSLTNGPLGVSGISRPESFGIDFSSNISFLLLTLILFAFIYFVSWFIVNSSFGKILKAIREDEVVIQVFGYNTVHFKLFVFVISSIMAVIAGALFASYVSFIDPSSFSVMESVALLAIVILGGLANLRGSILGAIILVLLPEILRFVGFPTEIAAQMRQLVYGVVLILLVMYRPQGLMGEYKL